MIIDKDIFTNEIFHEKIFMCICKELKIIIKLLFNVTIQKNTKKGQTLQYNMMITRENRGCMLN